MKISSIDDFLAPTQVKARMVNAFSTGIVEWIEMMEKCDELWLFGSFAHSTEGRDVDLLFIGDLNPTGGRTKYSDIELLFVNRRSLKQGASWLQGELAYVVKSTGYPIYWNGNQLTRLASVGEQGRWLTTNPDHWTNRVKINMPMVIKEREDSIKVLITDLRNLWSNSQTRAKSREADVVNLRKFLQRLELNKKGIFATSAAVLNQMWQERTVGFSSVQIAEVIKSMIVGQGMFNSDAEALVYMIRSLG